MKREAELRWKLVAKRKDELGESLDRAAVSDKVDPQFVFQPEALGLGHAVLCAREFRDGGPVGIILPDDVILGTPCLQEMTDAYGATGARHMVATMEVGADTISRYGVFALTGEKKGRAMRVSGMVEKPSAEDAPSNFAAVGRYILDDSIFDHLDGLPPGLGGEIQLTDAIDKARASEGLDAFEFSGTRYDCGSREGLFEASCAYRSMRLEKAPPSRQTVSAIAAE